MREEKEGETGAGRKVIMQIENLSKTYMQGKIPVHALRCACITVRKGELLAIMGPSGSGGKSTLLALIGTLEKATDGKIILDGTDLTSVPEKLLPGVRREKIGFIFQHYNLIPTLSALENVELAMRFSRVPKKREKKGQNPFLKTWGGWKTGSIINLRSSQVENSKGFLLQGSGK